MLKITLAFILAGAVPTCSSNKCINDGDSCADSFTFSLIDKSSQQDLVFGMNPVYNKDSVFLTTNLPGYRGKGSYVINDQFRSRYVLVVDTFFLRISVADTDTLLMQYDFVKDKCCPNDQYGRVTGIKFNGGSVQKTGDVFLLPK